MAEQTIEEPIYCPDGCDIIHTHRLKLPPGCDPVLRLLEIVATAAVGDEPLDHRAVARAIAVLAGKSTDTICATPNGTIIARWRQPVERSMEFWADREKTTEYAKP